MNALILVPVGILAVGLGWFPEPWLNGLPMPVSAWAALLLAALVAAVTRQYGWLYALGVAASLTFSLHSALSGQMGLTRAALIIQLAPCLAGVSWLLLWHLRWPPVLSPPGLVLLLSLSLLPAGMLAVFPTSVLAGTVLLESLLIRPVSGLYLSWLHWIVASMAGVYWLGILFDHKNLPRAGGLAGMTLALWVGLASLDQLQAAGWLGMALAATVTVALVLDLVRLAYLDELTGLPQRRALENRLQHLRHDVTLVMLDVDHFKSFNDTWGHDTGDQVLALLGSVLSRTRGIQAFRYGGEEFTLLIKPIRQESVERLLEALRQQIASQEFQVRQQGRPASDNTGRNRRGAVKPAPKDALTVTVSMGCARRAPAESPWALLKRADNALYKAKKAGRNRIVCDLLEAS